MAEYNKLPVVMGTLVLAVLGAAFVADRSDTHLTRTSFSFATQQTTIERPGRDSRAMGGQRGHASTVDVVLGGVDVVAYFDLSAGAAPVYGDAAHSVSLTTEDAITGDGFQSVFWFASQANADAFRSSPASYAPRFGGFCAYGMSSEFAYHGEAPMASANQTAGWPWAKDYLGPPANQSVWAVRDGKLYLAFLQAVLDVFLDDYESLSYRGEARWAEFYGTSAAAPTGPFNADCLASGYRETPTRTCTYAPQKLAGVESPRVFDATCVSQLNATCGAYRGDDPVNAGACSACLTTHATLLASVCPAAYDGTLQTKVDKAFCW